MDWDGAVRKHGEALKRILALLVAMAGLGPGEPAALVRRKGLRSGEAVGLVPAPTLPRRLHRAVLKLLRPAEAAVRRLIIVAARGLRCPDLATVTSSAGHGRTGTLAAAKRLGWGLCKKEKRVERREA